MEFNFDNLNETEFEEFCYELLHSLDFKNLSWRKGTGLSSSPSDQGRDIEGELIIQDIDKQIHIEKWFIECKHYKKGVPPEKIHNTIAWADSQKPDVLLIIASNYLSNPSKNYLKDYIKNNKPSYRIKIWEKNDLEHLTANTLKLRKKFNLIEELPFASYINNYHLVYAMKPQLNTIKYYFELMDQLDEEKRDKAFETLYHYRINPKYRKPKHKYEKLGDLQMEDSNYNIFKEKCLQENESYRPLFVYNLVTTGLSWIFNMADKSDLVSRIEMHNNMLAKIDADLKETSDEKKSKKLLGIKEFLKSNIKNLPKRTEEFFDLYNYICDNLVRKLLMEKPEIPKLTIDK